MYIMDQTWTAYTKIQNKAKQNHVHIWLIVKTCANAQEILQSCTKSSV